MDQKVKYLVDRSQPFDQQRVKMLDQLSISLSINTPEGKNAQQIWNLLKEDDYFWSNTDNVMRWSKVDQTKIFMLIILEYAIKQKWYVLAQQQRESLKNYMVNLIMLIGAKEDITKTQQNILSKSNSVLVQIIKYEWNASWKTFIPDICQASYSSQTVCQNNLYILKMLSEEIFDYSKNQMTTDQIVQLKQRMANDFLNIFQLCQDILSNLGQAKQSLVQACLETLLAFLSWIPIYYIVYSDVIQKLIFIISSEYLRGYTMSCLIEIAGLKVQPNNKEEVNKFLIMLKNATLQFLKIIPLYTDKNEIKKFKTTLRKKWMHFQTLARNISMFYYEFFKEQDSWLSNAIDGNQQMIQACRTGFNYMLMFMRIDDDQIFKICIQFFHFYIGKYLEKLSQNQFQNPNFGNLEHKTLQSVYKQVFMQVMRIISFKMAKPQQVLIVIDEDGVPYREQAKNTENSSLYEVMKELASFLVKVDWPQMKKFIISQIQAQQNNDHFSFDALNSLSWTVGSLCGSMVEKQEKNFFITSLRTLLHLCENKKGKQNKAVIASCIMYVVGQYPTFLRNNWTFLRTVVKKLFEFMKEQFPGIMDMACNAFLKIVKSTADQFVVVQVSDKQPFIREIIRKIPEETQKLTSDPLKFVFYQAVGHLIGAQKDSQTQVQLIRQTLGYSLYEFQNIVTSSHTNRQILLQQQVKLKILFFLKLNETLATGVGQMYALYLITINSELNSAYMFYSQQVRLMFEKGGKNVLSYLTMKQMRAIKRQVVRIYIRYLQKCENLTNQQAKYILESFIVPFGMPLIDFQNTPAEIKQHQFVSLFAVSLSKLHNVIAPEFFATVVDVIFNSTLPLITADFNSYPEIRENFFAFLKALIKYNFNLLYSLDDDKFQLILNCVIWSFRHELSTFTDLGLELLQDILSNVNSSQQTMNVFYPRYMSKIITQVLDVMTDGFHKSGLDTQTKIFYLLIQVITSNIIKSKISSNQLEGQSNVEFIYLILIDKLINAFPHTAKNVTEERVKGWFQQTDEQQFKDQIADYLVLINRYTPAEITESKKESSSLNNNEIKK